MGQIHVLIHCDIPSYVVSSASHPTCLLTPASAMILLTAVMVAMALTDRHGLRMYGRDASQILQPRSRRRKLHVRVPPLAVRGGGGNLDGNSRDAVDDRRPHMSVFSAWSKLASKRQSATEEERYVSKIDDNSKMSLPSPSLHATTLAAIWSFWNILDGTLLTFAPKDDPYDVVAYLVEAIGVVRISHGLQLFLSTVVGVPSKTSMGFAILPRLLFLIACLVMKTYNQLGVPQSTASLMVLVSTGGMFLTATALLSDRGRPYLMANLFSAMTLVEGCFMRFYANQTAAKLFRFNDAVYNSDRVPAKVRSLGFHLMISSIFMSSLANGISPIKAAGYSAVAWSLLLVDLVFGVGVYQGWSAVTGAYLFFLASALSCSFVFLLDNKWETLANLKRKHPRHIEVRQPALSKPISAKEKIDKFKLRINAIASSVGASSLATIGAKLGSNVDEKLASVNIASAASGQLMASIDHTYSRIIPTCSTVGIAMGASLGAVIGMKVANFIFARLEEVQRKVRRENN